MSSEELEFRLEKIRDKKLASEVRRFLLNIFLLFDGNPPPHIQAYIGEIMNILETQPVPVPIRFHLFNFL